MLDDTTKVAVMAPQVAVGELTEDYSRFERLFFPGGCSEERVSSVDDGSTGQIFWSISPRVRLADRVEQLCRFARFAYEEIDTERLARAQNEANVLVQSSVFSENLSPDVCIDRHGEISFTHRSEAGYLDIGVRGDGELSYHVRNDHRPEHSVCDDHYWPDFAIPIELLESVQELAG